MKKTILLLGGLAMTLSACATVDPSIDPSSQFIAELPEGVSSIAAPSQNLSAVRIDPIDGCYVYQHVGPVETTLLPLRATNGRPICGRAPS